MRLLALILLAVVAPAHNAGGDAVQGAYDRLVIVDEFAFGGTGYGGVTSEGEKEFRILFAVDSGAVHHFLNLYKNGNAQAKLYALVALKKLDNVRFKTLARQLSTDNPKVQTCRGCIMRERSSREVITEISRGDYDAYLKKENWHDRPEF